MGRVVPGPLQVKLHRSDVRNFYISIFISSINFILHYTYNWCDNDLKRFDIYPYDLV